VLSCRSNLEVRATLTTCKMTVMEDHGFWADVHDLLTVMEPAYTILRKVDGDAPMMGKIYYDCFKVCHMAIDICIMCPLT